MSHCACLQSWFCRRHLPSSQTHYSGCSDLRRILITSILPPFPCRPRRTVAQPSSSSSFSAISFHPWCSVRIACLHPPAGWMIYQARRIDRSSAESVDSICSRQSMSFDTADTVLTTVFLVYMIMLLHRGEVVSGQSKHEIEIMGYRSLWKIQNMPWVEQLKLSCRRQTERCFVSYFTKSLKVTQGHSKLHTRGGNNWSLLFHCNCLYLVPFLRSLASNNGMTLKSGLGLVQGHWKWYHLKAWMWFPIHIPCPILYHFRDKAMRYWSKIALFYTPCIPRPR